ncbi:MAG: MBL fold metallo-hydrolase [Candidatus Dormibacteraeota bacterium]|uniref:MBL fold metallo-hydrolase n=1 Tax=Candidatus Amunia macphersoniae TaxID=3127014 RepID=A0A934NGR9_9BACT|nr:MBL fold metallo-hydrolase [Candidatus Dormibacteraeota bacterium]
MDLIAPGIRQIDTLLGGMDRMTAGFLIDGAQPALVETGSQSSVAAVREALTAAGLGAADLRWIVVTHIHLDHAGGVGDMAAAFPNATVVVHERGARHLVDPSRLIDSAARVYGPLLDGLYGRMLPVPEERLVAAADGHRVDLGDGHFLTMVDSPGHAKHHHAVLDEHTGTLLVGDAVGVKLPDVGILRPATPPPDFDLEQATASLRRFTELRPQQVVLTHYGPVADPIETLTAAEDMLHRWVEVADRTMRASEDAGIDDVATALAEAFAALPPDVPDAVREKLEVLNGVHSNAAGIVRYLAQREPAHLE